ncbi:prepilin peptidase [Pseudahrensia aquimaris]|uniref:Prepilin peptidase n=1 Tax=Pseudahrensia aquimaris TaxID=744461 RepID=A0ABW3FIK1_9HYPH
MIATLLLTLFVCCMIIAMISDILTQKISNHLSLALLAGFAISVPLIGMSWQLLGITMLIGIVVFAIGFLMFLLGGMGAGDVKMMFSSVLWVGPVAVGPYINALAISSVVLIALVFAARKLTPLSLAERVPFFHAWLVNPMGGVPYGVPLGIAGLYAIASTQLFKMAVL